MNNAAVLRLPPGYRFKPSDDEAMHHLFHKINTGVALMPGINDVNLYDYSPETLARTYPPLGDEEWYFFTPTQRKHPNSKRPERSAGNGFWRAMTADTKLERGGETIGRKLTLVYHFGSNRGQGVRSRWMMHEFRVEKYLHVRTHANDMTLVDWVLCKLYQNSRRVEVNRARITRIARVPAAARGEEFNNGGAVDSGVLINQQQQQYHHHHHQTMLFGHNSGNQAAIATEFNNGSAFGHNSANLAAIATEFNNGSALGCMMMSGQDYINPQHYHHQTMLFDHNTSNHQPSASASARGKEFNNGDKGEVFAAGCTIAAEYLGTLFNSQNYNSYLDKTSLFNNDYAYANNQAAATIGGSHDFINGNLQYSRYVDQCSSSNVNVEAQGFYNGSGKTVLNNNQEDYHPSLDQIVYDGVEAGAEFCINGRERYMMQGERVETGDDFVLLINEEAAMDPR